jgi:hypothetical protein
MLFVGKVIEKELMVIIRAIQLVFLVSTISYANLYIHKLIYTS